MGYVLENLAASALLIAVFWLPGYLLWPRFGAAGVDPYWRRLVELALGLGCWTTLTFLLASVRQLHTTSVGLAVAIVLGLAAGAAWRRRGSSPAVSFPDLRALWPGALFAIPLVPIAWLAMSPPVSWDASAYHLTLPKLFLAHGGFRPVEMNVYSHWPMGGELLFALAMLLRDHVLAKLVHFGFGLATCVAIVALCRRWHRPESGILAVAFFLANPVVVFELRVANVDLAQTFFTTLALAMMLEATGSEDGPLRRGELLLAGICCGLVAAIKVQGIVTAGLLALLLAPRILHRETRSDGFRALLLFSLPVAALWLPWLVKAAWFTGNPVYPLLYETFGGPDWSSALGEQFHAWQRSIGMGREPLDYLLLPLRVILLGGWGYGTFDGEIGAFWLLLVPLAILCSRGNYLARRALLLSALFFGFWSLTSQQIRFLVPFLPLLSMAAGIGMVELLERLRSPRERRLALGMVQGMALALTVFYASHSMNAGWRALQRYQAETGNLLATAVPPVDRFIGESLPPGAKLLFLNTNQGFFCPRDYLADSFFEASQIADWLAPAQDVAQLRRLLEERDITHVLLDHRERGIAYPRSLFELLADPEQSSPLWRSPDGRSTLFALRRATS